MGLIRRSFGTSMCELYDSGRIFMMSDFVDEKNEFFASTPIFVDNGF